MTVKQVSYVGISQESTDGMTNLERWNSGFKVFVLQPENYDPYTLKPNPDEG